MASTRIALIGIVLTTTLLTANGCALLLRAAPAGARGMGAAVASAPKGMAAEGAAGAVRGGAAGAVRGGGAEGVARGAPGGAPAPRPAPVGGLLFANSQLVAAGVGALALGRALPPGIAKMYAPTGQPIGTVEIRGRTAAYYDNFGRLGARSELNGTTTSFYDATNRLIGTSRPAGGNQTNFYSPENQLVGYQVLDGGRIIWHFDAENTLIGYTILGEVDLAALGAAPDAFVYSLPTLTPLVGGSPDKQGAEERSIQEDRSVKPLSTKVITAADTLFNVSHRCRTEAHVDSCREVSLAYADLSEAIREEMLRLSRPSETKPN